MERKVNKKYYIFILASLFILGLLIISGRFFQWISMEKMPDQPIAFSHKLHTGKVGLKCTHCHGYTDKSRRAGIPEMKICADCHLKVAVDKPEIKKLMKYWEDKEPVPWNKVHNLPWHVHFTHKRHIKAGIDCSVCHGEVRAMTTARQVRSLDMGWCVNCHREKGAPTDCLVCHK